MDHGFGGVHLVSTVSSWVEGVRLLSPTNSFGELHLTTGFNTSTICYTNDVFNVHAGPSGLGNGRLGRTIRLIRNRGGGVCVAYGALPEGSRVPFLPSFLGCTRSVNISTFVVTSVKILTTTGGCTPGISIRVSARTNVMGCTSTGTFCSVNTAQVIATHRLSLSRVGAVHSGYGPGLRVRTFIRNTVYVDFDNEYALSGCLANESTGEKSYTRPYH